MERLTGHHELEELLGAYALDAVDPEEAEALEHHLSTCPRCRAELAEHREVAALLGYAGAAAPAGVWDRIVASLEEPPPAMRLSQTPFQQVGPARTSDGPGRPPAGETLAPVVPIKRGRTVSSRMTVALATAAAVIAVAAVGVGVGRIQTRRSNQPLGPQAIQARLYDVANSTPGVRHITLTSADNATRVPAVVLPNGTSVLGKSDLPPLPSNETYQLWGVVGAQQVSLRVVGADPNFATFTTPPSVTILAMTVEQQGGVVTSTQKPVVSGLVPA